MNLDQIQKQDDQSTNIDKITSFLKCQQPGCDLYLQTPVILPCGATICNEHIQDDAVKFECQLCNLDHLMPDDGHFLLNKLVNDMIESNQHLKGFHKQVNQSLLKLDRLIDDFKSIRKETISFDYFAKLRRKIDIHREELIQKIHEKSQNLIDELAKYENECKIIQENDNQLKEIEDEKIKLNKNEVNEWKSRMRQINLNESEMDDLSDKINSMINCLTIKKETYERRSINGLSIRFEPENDETFGELIIDHKKSMLKKFHAYGHNDIITAVKIINGKLITGSQDSTIKLWDLEKGICLKTLTYHDGGIRCFEMLSDTKMLSASDDRTIKMWNVTENDISYLNTIVTESKQNQICSLFDKYVFAGDQNGYITCWTISDLCYVECARFSGAYQTKILVLKITNNMHLISLSKCKFSYSDELKVWQLIGRMERNLKVVCLQKIKFDCSITRIEVKTIENKDAFFCFKENDKIELWDCESGRLKMSSVLNIEGIVSMKLIKNNTLVSVILDNSEMKIYMHNFNSKETEVLKLDENYKEIRLLEEFDNDNLIFIDKNHNVNILDVNQI